MWSFGASQQTPQGSDTNDRAPPFPQGGFGSSNQHKHGFGNVGTGGFGGFGVAPTQGPAHKISFGSQQVADAGMEEDQFDYEEAKRQTLQSMPTFAGQKMPAPDHTDQAKKQERAARFHTASTSAIEARKAEIERSIPSTSEKKAIVGTCEDMCPAAERERRQNMSDIQIFERVHPDNINLTSADLAVKRFARTVDDPHPSDFRTRGALTRTMTYLRGLLDRDDVRFGLVHKFLWDRYRSVRQDLYIQGIIDAFAINIFEEIVRFHVLCEHELCGEDQSVTDMEGFNSHLNMEQMNKALISLNDMYEKAAERGEKCENESEFRSYHLLSLMSQHGKFKGDQQAFLSTLQSLRQEVRDSDSIQWVLKLRSAFVFGNFARFFTLIKEAPYLLACLAHIYFPQMRAKCFKIMSETITPGRSGMLEASWLVRTLLLDSETEALKLAKLHGFESSLDDQSEPAVVLVRGDFEPLPTPVERYPSSFISSMAPGRRSECVVSGADMTASGPHRTQSVAAMQEHEKLKQMEIRRKMIEDTERRLNEQKERDALMRQQEEEAQQKRELERIQQKQEMERIQREQEIQRIQQEQELEIARQKAREQRIQQERELELARQKAEEERIRREQEMEAARQKAEEERIRREQEMEVARQKAEEERIRCEQEMQRRLYLLQKLKEAIISKRYLTKWVQETRQRIAERERIRISAMNLKACRVGVRANRHRPDRKRGRDDSEQEPGSPSKRQMHVAQLEEEEASFTVSEIVLPILCERNEGLPRIFWKVSVLSLHRNFTSDPVARYINSCASLDSYSMSSGQQYNELVYQEMDNLSICFEFISSAKLEAGHLSGYLEGSSAVIICAAGEQDVSITSLRQELTTLSKSWGGPSIPIAVISGEGESEALLESGFHVRILPCHSHQDRGMLENTLAWIASASPPQPDFTVISLKQSISQGIRSFLQDEGSNKHRGLQLLGHMAHDRAIELVLQAIDESYKSTAACWRWPPKEFDMGVINDWYSMAHYKDLVQAVRAMYTEINESGSEYLSLLSMNALMDRACPSDMNLVIPDSVSGKFSRLFYLQPSGIFEQKENIQAPLHTQNASVEHNSLQARAQNVQLRNKLRALEEELNLERMASSSNWRPITQTRRNDPDTWVSRLKKHFLLGRDN